MNHSLKRQVADFFDANWDRRRGILLAFSGGPDSLALLHLLLCYRNTTPLPIALAHINHNWRQESSKEADEIAILAEQFGVKLYTKTLDPKEIDGNLEAECRKIRLQFFSEICATDNYQAVLLGHHADDFAETVLKRVFEGSTLCHLSALRPVSELYGVQVWRPLLAVSKSALLDYLSTKQLAGFDDSTNRNLRYLRARMRAKLIPYLSEEFGKEISPGLCQLGNDAAELREYLDSKTAPFLARQVEQGPFGTLLDLSTNCPDSLFEIKHLIRRFSERLEFGLSRSSVEAAARFVKEGAADKMISSGSKHLYIDRRRLFALTETLQELPKERVALSEGVLNYGALTVKTTFLAEPIAICSDWRSFWVGKGEVVLPANHYCIGSPNLNDPYPGSSPLSKWWTNNKIPSFFRSLAPVIYRNESMTHEFLTGKMRNQQRSVDEGEQGFQGYIKIAWHHKKNEE